VLDSNLHFAGGLLIGTVWRLARLLRAWRAREKLAGHFRAWLLAAYGLGLWAVVPNLLRRAGLPEAACNAWWMNVFLLHPFVNGVASGGRLIGRFSIALVFVLQYAMLVAAIRGRRS